MDYLHSVSQYVMSHAGPFLAGAILTRPVLCADLVFSAIMKSPLKPLVLMNAPTINKWIDAFQAEFQKNIDEDKAKEAPKA